MITILGAGGFLGYSLAYELNSLHYNYTTVSRSFQWQPFTSENRFLCPVSYVESYSQNFTNDSTVIYMAGSTDLALAESDDVSDLEKHENEMRMFFAGLSDSVHLPSKFIFFSSAGTVYGDAQGCPATETSPLQPKSAYGRRNVALENLFSSLVHSLGQQAHVFRISNPFGPRQFLFRRKGLIQSLISSSFNNSVLTLRADGLQSRDYISAQQLSVAVIQACSLDNLPQYLNFSSGFSFTAIEIVDILINLGLSPQVTYSSESFPFEVQDSVVSPQLLCSHLKLKQDHFFPFAAKSAYLQDIVDQTRKYYLGG